MVAYDNEDDFIFLNNLKVHVMRYFNETDSIKKTNISVLMEFVSLYCFNGELIYPTIKKSKEINYSMTGRGFQPDMYLGLSRIAETVRVGCSLYSSFIHQLIQVHFIRRCYSLNKGMHNYMESINYNDIPIDFFGNPGFLPYEVFIGGNNAINRRLLEYSSTAKNYMLSNLYDINKTPMEFMNDTLNTLNTCLYDYTKDQRKVYVNRENTGYNYDDYIKFYDEHPLFKICKPYSFNNLVKHYKLRYFSNSFCEAYSRIGEITNFVRMQKFTKNNVITEKYDNFFRNKREENLEMYNMYSIRTYQELKKREAECISQEVLEKFTQDTVGFVKTITKADNYSSLLLTQESLYAVSRKGLPIKYTPDSWGKLDLSFLKVATTNKLQDIFYYLFDSQELKESNTFNDEQVLQEDVKRFSEIFKEKLTIENIMLVYAELMNNDQGLRPTSSKFHSRFMTQIELVPRLIKHNGTERMVEVELNKKATYVDILRGSNVAIRKSIERRFMANALLSYMSLLKMLKVHFNMSIDEGKFVMENVVYSDVNLTISLSNLLSEYIGKLQDTELFNDETKVLYYFGVLYNNIELISAIDEKVSIYWYDWVKKSVDNNNNMIGLNKFTFVFFGDTYNIDYNYKNKESRPLLYTTKNNVFINILAYWISLRICGVISNKEFNTLVSLKPSNLFLFKSVSSKQRSLLFQGVRDGKLTIGKPENLDTILPIIFVKKLKHTSRKYKDNLSILKLSVDIENMLMKFNGQIFSSVMFINKKINNCFVSKEDNFEIKSANFNALSQSGLFNSLITYSDNKNIGIVEGFDEKFLAQNILKATFQKEEFCINVDSFGTNILTSSVNIFKELLSGNINVESFLNKIKSLNNLIESGESSTITTSHTLSKMFLTETLKYIPNKDDFIYDVIDDEVDGFLIEENFSEDEINDMDKLLKSQPEILTEDINNITFDIVENSNEQNTDKSYDTINVDLSEKEDLKDENFLKNIGWLGANWEDNEEDRNEGKEEEDNNHEKRTNLDIKESMKFSNNLDYIEHDFLIDDYGEEKYEIIDFSNIKIDKVDPMERLRSAIKNEEIKSYEKNNSNTVPNVKNTNDPLDKRYLNKINITQDIPKNTDFLVTPIRDNQQGSKVLTKEFFKTRYSGTNYRAFFNMFCRNNYIDFIVDNMTTEERLLYILSILFDADKIEFDGSAGLFLLSAFVLCLRKPILSSFEINTQNKLITLSKDKSKVQVLKRHSINVSQFQQLKSQNRMCENKGTEFYAFSLAKLEEINMHELFCTALYKIRDYYINVFKLDINAIEIVNNLYFRYIQTSNKSDKSLEDFL